MNGALIAPLAGYMGLSQPAKAQCYNSRMRVSLALPALALWALLAPAQTAPEVEITAEPHHHLAFQNQHVRVFKVEVAPHEATLMHRHRHDYIFVTLGASEVSNDVVGKPPVTLKLQDGEVRFTPGDFAHLARNLALTPFRNVTIEFIRDQQAHKSPPPKWDEEHGLRVLSGGTQEILMVKDGVRVSEIELNTAGVLPKHRHAGPHLVVAVTDLELRSQVAAQQASNIELKAGDIKWVPGDLTHTLTNVGPQQAKFVTLEFH
jgi:quercetin dioxygenase-like cupin family protein